MESLDDVNDVDGIPQSKIHPRYLHSNSTSHIWAFGAIAELIDNAYDPDVAATELCIDNKVIHDQSCLVFLDNGNGMDRDKLLKMLSFGYCEKDDFNAGEHKPVGLYGNGFKTGSMRLGKDVIVFTRRRGSACIGLLSQTYLQGINADSILVPILEYKLPTMLRMKSITQNNLDAILRYSPFNSEKELKEQLKSFESSVTGTKIFIYNLNRLQDGREELDFVSVPIDIRCPEAFARDTSDAEHRPTEYVPEYRKSLRAYCSILYFKPKMKIFIREKVVKTKYIPKMLHETQKIKYKPSKLKTEKKTIQIFLGFSCEKDCKQNYGFLMYNKNRLIKAYEKVGCQKLSNEKGVGVIGVVELDYLKTIHNKQDFNQDLQYNTVMNALATKLNAYWNDAIESVSNEEVHLPDWDWAQCGRCLKWRRLPTGTDPKLLPDEWFCYMNEDQMYNRCSMEEEPDHDEKRKERKKKSSPSKSTRKTSKSKLSSSQPEASRDKSDDQRKSVRLTSSQPETAKKYGRNIFKSKTLKDKSKNNKNNSNANIDDDFDIPFLANLPIRKAAKRRLKSTITTNIAHSQSQPGIVNSIEPRPGCSKDSDESDDPNNSTLTEPPVRKVAKRQLRSNVVDNIIQSNCHSDSIEPRPGCSKDSDKSEHSSSLEPPIKKAAKRQLRSNVANNILTQSDCHSGNINSLEPRPGCSKDSDDIVGDDFNNSKAKKRFESMGHTESNSDNMNTESNEAVESHRNDINQSLQNNVDEYDSFTLPPINNGLVANKSEMSTQTDLKSSGTGTSETDTVTCKKETESRRVQTEITYDKDGLTEFHQHVHTLLTLMAPNDDFGEVINIEDVVNKLIDLYLGSL